MAASNPFTFTDEANTSVLPTSDFRNPFVASEEIDIQKTSNPFSDFMSSSEQTEPSVNLSTSNPFSFVSTDCSTVQKAACPDDALLSARRSPTLISTGSATASPIPVSDETLHLLLSVTGHMEANSETLVEHLDQVKTPRHSPPPHSKSPSPTLEADPVHDAAFSAVFAQTVEEFSDNENEVSKEKPACPPSQAINVIIEDEPVPSMQIDLWDTGESDKTKTKAQILSLFNKVPEKTHGVDLLSEIPDQDLNLDNISPNVDTMQSSSVSTDDHQCSNTVLDLDAIQAGGDVNNSGKTSAFCSQQTTPTQYQLNTEDERNVDITITDSPRDTTIHTASAFMESYQTEIPQSVITPPTPISPIEPSPLPSILSSPLEPDDKAIVASPEKVLNKLDTDGSHLESSSHSQVFYNVTKVEKSTVGNKSHATSPLQKPPPPPPRPTLCTPFSTANTTNRQSTTNQIADNTIKPESGLLLFGELISTDEVSICPTSEIVTASTSDQRNTAAANPPGSFDSFARRFEEATKESSSPRHTNDPFANSSAFGENFQETSALDFTVGFGDTGGFDEFLAMTAPPVPHSTPCHRATECNSYGGADMSIVIKPREESNDQVAPVLSAPPKLSPFQMATPTVVEPSTMNVNPFAPEQSLRLDLQTTATEATSADDSSLPDTPLFDEDVSQPLEPFPRTTWKVAEFSMFLRQPNKKKITGQRFWKKIFVRLNDNAVLQLFHDENDSEPFQELPLQACYSVSDISTQQYDQYGKIFTMKLQYIFYKERPGMRPGQVTKAERITKKLGQFAMSAWEGDYDRVKEFASDVRKLGMPVEHAPQISQLVKLGTQTYEDLKLLSSYIEEILFKLTVSRDRALTYKTEEIQISGVDEVYIELDSRGSVLRQLARVRLFFLAFLSGMPEVELGINDLRRQGKEVVSRHDIIPVATEEWIRLEDITFHSIIDKQAFEDSKILKFQPPDGCYIELMRYRIRPPRHRELPLQVKVKMTILTHRVEIAGEILVPGYISRKMGQIPCEDVVVRIPLPECWVYMFRVEKHFRYGSVKAAHRRQGKVKGLDRFLGAVDAPEQTLMEVSSGTAKYERHHRAIVWRIPRLPKEGQGAYTNHTFSCKMHLTSFDQMPESLETNFMVEFTMPHTTVSHTVCRSASLTGSSSDPPEKYVRYLARYECRQQMDVCYTEQQPSAYTSAAITAIPEQTDSGIHSQPQPPSSDSSSDSD